MLKTWSGIGRWLGSSASWVAGEAWRRLLRITPTEMTSWAVVALVWLGLALRSRGMWLNRPISLWGDEAAWAMWLIDLPLKDHVVRSLGFMTVSKGLVTVFGASERVLRFLPWCAGVGVVLVAPFLAKRLFRSSAAQVLFVAVLALHPSAIDLSKEFKPYSVALLLHMLLLLFLLRYWQTEQERDLLTGVGLAFFGVLFSQDVVFAYPMVFGLLALKAYRSKNREHLITLFVGATLAVGLLLAVLHNVAPKLGDTKEGAQYWGNKYDVFYAAGAEQGSRLSWTIERLHDLASMPGNRRDLWQWSGVSQEALAALKRVEASVWTCLCAAGLALMAYQRRFLHLALLLSPLLVMLGFNYFGFWPLGAFRTNLFSIAYCGGLAAAAFDWQRGETGQLRQLAPALLLVALLFVTLGRSNHSRKQSLTAHAAYPQAAKALVALQGRKRRRDALVLDAPSCAPWRYYTNYHPDKERQKLASRFAPQCSKSFHGMLKAARRALTTPDAHVFMLAVGDAQMDGLQNRMPRDLHVVDQKLIGRRDALVMKIERARR